MVRRSQAKVDECFRTCYRADSTDDGADGWTTIEWADKLLPLLPARTIHVHLRGLGDEPREIRIEEPVSDPTR